MAPDVFLAGSSRWVSSRTDFMAVVQFLKRNLLSISAPVVSLTLIYLDWSYTKQWKSQQKK